jgi:hypothetical protein
MCFSSAKAISKEPIAALGSANALTWIIREA